jgi:hypothetical protein
MCAIPGSLVGYFLAALASRQYPYMLNGSVMYLPALLVLFVIASYHYLANKPRRRLPLIACGAFLLSLTFRTIDNAVCPVWPTGTHFLWHVLNAITLYILMVAYLACIHDLGNNQQGDADNS